MTRQPYPPRLWTLAGYPGSGKSTFAAQMRGPILTIDADNRFSEVLSVTQSDVYSLSDLPSDNTDTERIASILKADMPGSEVSTIVVDSLTAIIAPLVTKAIQDNDAGRNRNRAAAFKDKALAMRQLQDAVTRWGKDVLWIYHLQDGRDGQGNKITRATVSETELSRLMRSINLQLQVVEENGKRGIKVIWARRGRDQIVLWDETGKWSGMPERIEKEVYGGLSENEQDQIENQIPTQFPNIETAIAWAVATGAFKDIKTARAAYDAIKLKHAPKNAAEMAHYWTQAVIERRKG